MVHSLIWCCIHLALVHCHRHTVRIYYVKLPSCHFSTADQNREPSLVWSIYFRPHHYFAEGPFTLRSFSMSLVRPYYRQFHLMLHVENNRMWIERKSIRQCLTEYHQRRHYDCSLRWNEQCGKQPPSDTNTAETDSEGGQTAKLNLQLEICLTLTITLLGRKWIEDWRRG